MTKYVFVTGGAVSTRQGHRRRVVWALILESRGLKVTHLKLDPHINVDPGTMSPFQHGEVFVTEDGAETDLDLGHYERFTSAKMSKRQQLHHRPDLRVGDQEGTARRVSGQDGAGHPAHHRRDQEFVAGAKGPTWRSSRVGGTVGDIESLPSLRPSARWGWKRA